MPGNIALPFCKLFHWNQRRAIKLAIRMQSVQVSAVSARQTCLKKDSPESHPFLKDSGDDGKALHAQAAAKISFTNNGIISIIIASYGQKLRQTIADFYRRFKTGGGWCPSLHSTLLPPQLFFFASAGFLPPGPH